MAGVPAGQRHLGANVEPRLHALAASAAARGGVSLAEWVRRAVRHAIGIPGTCTTEAEVLAERLRAAEAEIERLRAPVDIPGPGPTSERIVATYTWPHR